MNLSELNLAELIQYYRRERGLTWRQLQAYAGMGVFNLADVNRPLTEFPRRRTIYGLAQAFHLDPIMILNAAERSLGFVRVERPPSECSRSGELSSNETTDGAADSDSDSPTDVP